MIKSPRKSQTHWSRLMAVDETGCVCVFVSVGSALSVLRLVCDQGKRCVCGYRDCEKTAVD
jgi:hypothetical protein